MYKVNVTWFLFSCPSGYFPLFLSFNYDITVCRCIVNIMKVNIERNNLQLELIPSETLFTFTFAKRRVQCSNIFTSNARLFARWQQVLMPCISERFEAEPVRTLSMGDSNYLLFTTFLTASLYKDIMYTAQVDATAYVESRLYCFNLHNFRRTTFLHRHVIQVGVAQWR